MLYKDLLPNFIKCYTMFSTNDWHSETEPFLTNDSLVNAGVCWILWLIMSLSAIITVVLVLGVLISHKCNPRIIKKTFGAEIDGIYQYFTGKDKYQLERESRLFKNTTDSPVLDDDGAAKDDGFQRRQNTKTYTKQHCMISLKKFEDEDEVLLLK